MAVVGRIPENLVIVRKPEENVTQAYTGKVFQARPAFAVDANSEKMVAQARSWGSRHNHWHQGNQPPPDVLEGVANDPITELRITNVEHRGEGGVAYKVITNRGHLVDLREDEFMEAVFEDRIRGGVITGEYVWSQIGSQMRLIRVGSKKHKDLLVAGKRVQKGRIPARELIVGNRYRGKGAAYADSVFLGRVRIKDGDGKNLFAWGSITKERFFDYGTITQSSSMVENLGPTGHTRKEVSQWFDGFGTTRHPSSHLEWL